MDGLKNRNMHKEISGLTAAKLELSKACDSIIQECHCISNSASISKSHEFGKSQSKVTLIHDQLNSKHFSKNHFISFLPPGRSNLDVYLEAKEKEAQLSPKLSEILSSSPTNQPILRNSPSGLTFQSMQGPAISQLLLANKRGFGKSWKETPNETRLNTENAEEGGNFHRRASNLPGLSPVQGECRLSMMRHRLRNEREPVKLTHKADLSGIHVENAKLPQLSSPHRHLQSLEPVVHPLFPVSLTSPSQNDISAHESKKSLASLELGFKYSLNKRLEKSEEIEKSSNLSSFVNRMMEKNFGIRRRQSGPDIEGMRMRESKGKIKKTGGEESKNEGEYLNPEFVKHNEDVINKLKVQRIMVMKHLKKRRDLLINFPPMRKIKKTDSFAFVDDY
jgi:hypothetical protein